MDTPPDQLLSSAPFPTIPTPTTPRRAAKPRRHTAPSSRSDRPAPSPRSWLSGGGDPSAFVFGAPGGAGPPGSRPAAFAFGFGSAASSGKEENLAGKFVFGSGESGALDANRGFSFGSRELEGSLLSLSEAAEELSLKETCEKNDADVCKGNDSMSETKTNTGDGFVPRESVSNLCEEFCSNVLHEQTKELDAGRAIPPQTIGCENAATSSFSSQVFHSSSRHDKISSTEFAKDADILLVDDSGDKANLMKDGSSICADGGHTVQNLVVFGECNKLCADRGDTAETNFKKVGSLKEEENLTCSSEQVGASAAQDNSCTKFTFQAARHTRGSNGSDTSHMGPHEIHTTTRTSNSAANFGSLPDSVKVSITELADAMETKTEGTALELDESGSFDEKSFSVPNHNAVPRDKGEGKGMGMNRRTVKPKKFSSAHQNSSALPVFTGEHFSRKMTPETNLHLKEIFSLKLEDSDIGQSSSGAAEVDTNYPSSQTTESSDDGRGYAFASNLENSGQSDFIFAAANIDQSSFLSQRRQRRKNCQGTVNNTNSVQSCLPSAIDLARSEVSESWQLTSSVSHWTEYSNAAPKTVTVSREQACAKKTSVGDLEDCETWRIRGNQAYAEGQLAKAEECYTYGINSVSPNEASQKALMLCYSNRAATRMSLGRMREALSDCQKANEIDPSFLKAQVRAANCLLALGEVEEAIKGFKLCLESNNKASLDHKISAEASDGLQKAQKVSSFMLQCKEYLVTKAFDEVARALRLISDALSISNYSDSLMKMKAEALLLLRRYEEVIQFCEETLPLAERNSVSLFPDEHSKIIDSENGNCPVSLWHYYLVAKSYFFLGNLEEAHQFLKKHEQATLVECRYGKQSPQSVLSFFVTVCELLRLKAAGNEAFQAGKYSEAVEHYTAALVCNNESLPFTAICFGNRAAAYQAMGQILDAIADCSLAIALDANYSKAISRRASLYELIRDYDQAANDLCRLISLLEKQLQENMSMSSEKSDSIRNNLNRANLRLSALQSDARKVPSLNMHLILYLEYLIEAPAFAHRGIEPSCSAADVKKAYRKAALRHHPDKAGNFLVRSENANDASWREIADEIRRDADYLFKIIGKAYAVLSDPTVKSK